eukprot:7419_1
MDSKINRKKRIITDLQRLRDPREAHLPKYDIRQEKANDLNVIYTEIRGPEDTPYSGGYFVIRFEFTSDYPVSSPSVAFATKIWHPNVDHNSGSVCLNSLNQNWQPTVNIRHILDTHMPWLLKNGNPDDPLNTDAGQQMKNKDPKYESIVKQWVRKFAYKSQLHAVGSVWYKDQPKKKRKKKKFSIAELTKSNTHNTNTKSKPDIKIASNLPPISPMLTKKRAPSKSVGNMDDFQDWWTQSKHLPNTPSKSATPQMMRSHSFCLRHDSSPCDLMKMVSDEKTIKKNVDINMKANKKRKRKHKHKQTMELSDNESDLSSMDEDPVYDLGTYQSLNSFDIGLCINNYKWSGSQTPSYLSSNSRHSTSNHRHSISNHNHNNSHNHNENHSHMYGHEMYSKSDGFMPQNSFFCPEFSPLCPAKSNSFMNLHDINDHERILHFAPLTDTQSNAQISVENDEEDDDDDMVPIPNTKNIESNQNKMKHKLVDIDIDVKDKNKNAVRMSLD